MIYPIVAIGDPVLKTKAKNIPADMPAAELQQLITDMYETMYSASEAVVSISAFSRCSARRKAVLRPMPGSRDSSPTAFSISFEGNSIYSVVSG